MGGCRGGTVEEDGEAEGTQDLAGVRQSLTASSIVEPASGTKGSTSRTPILGCSPACEARSSSDCARLGEGNGASEHGVFLAGEGKDAAVVVWVRNGGRGYGAGDGPNGPGDARDLRPVFPFGEVRHCLEKCVLAGPFSSRRGRGRGGRRR